MKPLYRWILFAAIFGFWLVAGNTIIQDFALEVNFLHFRLAKNVHYGYGPVYNPGDSTLLFYSPFAIVPYAIAADAAMSISTILAAAVYALSSVLVVTWLEKNGIRSSEAGFVVIFMAIAWPSWIGFRTPSALTFLFLLAGVEAIHSNRLRTAGLFGGLAALSEPSGILAAVLLGLFALPRTNSTRYWQTVWILPTMWLVYAVFAFSGYILPVMQQATLTDTIWIAALLISILALTRENTPTLVWIFALWSSFQLSLDWAIHGHFTHVTNPAISLVIGTALVLTVRETQFKYAAKIGSLLLVAALTLISLPTLSNQFEQDRQLAVSLNLPRDASILHDRSDAFSYVIGGNVYRVDTARSTVDAAFIQREDYASLISKNAPDYILLMDNEIVSSAAINNTALDYGLISESNSVQLWQRQKEVGTFRDVQSVEHSFRPDVHLTGYALDRVYIDLEQTLRIRLDWRLDHLPDQGAGLNLNLVDLHGRSFASAAYSYNVQNWSVHELTTYHALRIPDEIPEGVYQARVNLEYNAGIMGTAIVGNLIHRFDTTTPNAPIVRLGDIALYEVSLSVRDNSLNIETTWSIDSEIPTDYLLFAHISPLDGVNPVAQSDGPPVEGRYPTQYWRPGDFIVDQRQIFLEDVTPGTYRLNMGFYTLQGGRLQADGTDFIEIARINISDDGEISITED